MFRDGMLGRMARKAKTLTINGCWVRGAVAVDFEAAKNLRLGTIANLRTNILAIGSFSGLYALNPEPETQIP